MNAQRILVSSFVPTFVQCLSASFVQHSLTMFVKSLDMLFVHLAYFDYALDVNCVKLLASSTCTLSPMSTEVTLDTRQ